MFDLKSNHSKRLRALNLADGMEEGGHVRRKKFVCFSTRRSRNSAGHSFESFFSGMLSRRRTGQWSPSSFTFSRSCPRQLLPTVRAGTQVVNDWLRNAGVDVKKAGRQKVSGGHFQ
jgi:hypothetical protein